jgi:hypothetical protein
MAKSTSPTSRVEPQRFRRLKAGDTRFDETDVDGSPSELPAKASLCRDRQAAKLLSPDKLAPAGVSVESNTRENATQTKSAVASSPEAKLPLPAHQWQRINSFSYALLVAGEFEARCRILTGNGTIQSNGANPAAAEPL